MMSDELDLVEFRLEYLNPYVDYFFIVEAKHTHTGEEKPLYFTEAMEKGRFWEYNNKILIGYPNLSELRSSDFSSLTHDYDLIDPKVRQRENKQRNHFACFPIELKDNDLILMSDVDEIPDGPFIKDTGVALIENYVPFCLKQSFFYYSVNWLFKERASGTIGVSAQLLKETTPQTFRDKRESLISFEKGWHFSYFGSPEKIQKKIQTFSHQEYNKEPYTNLDYIQYNINTGRDPFDRKTPAGSVYIPPAPSDVELPSLLQTSREKYQWMFQK